MCIQKKHNYKEEYRSELMRSIEASHSRLVHAVEAHRENKDNKPINNEDLNSFPLGVWVEINDKIRGKKRKNRFSNYLNFDVEIEKGGEFGEHFHNDVIESTEVIYGELLDTSSGKVYKKGDVAQWEKGEKHTPIAMFKTLVHVLFKL